MSPPSGEVRQNPQLSPTPPLAGDSRGCSPDLAQEDPHASAYQAMEGVLGCRCVPWRGGALRGQSYTPLRPARMHARGPRTVGLRHRAVEPRLGSEGATRVDGSCRWMVGRSSMDCRRGRGWSWLPPWIMPWWGGSYRGHLYGSHRG